MSLEGFYKLEPYSLERKDKAQLLLEELVHLTHYHSDKCKMYSKIISFKQKREYESLFDLPFIPVRLFKEYDLLSVDKSEIVKTMTSSGTTGQSVSKIYLNKENVQNQTRTLASIITSFIGKQRLPMLMLDTELVKKDRAMFSARGAGIIGFSTFGRNIVYALDENMHLDVEKVKNFCLLHSGEPVLMFGYTYMIWQFVVSALEEANIIIPFGKVILFHIGGWKKLKEQAVDSIEYNKRVNAVFGGNVDVHNYYGMAEQLGSVFVECEHGHMHCSNFSDVIIRRPSDFSAAEFHERGLVELLSVLPVSYPGHIILTEDEGEILGEDDCPCGRKGKYFKIHGRIKGAEIRGCSDTYEKR